MQKISFCLALFFTSCAFGQSGDWKGKKCAVVLTYDDALNVHLDKAIPSLDSSGLKGSFYLTVFAPASKNRIEEWRKAARNGHELGNHTLYHPCNGGPGREWVQPERDLTKYTVARMSDEIKMTNAFLEAIDGKKERTFAYPCGDMTAGGESYLNSIYGEFIAARNGGPQIQKPKDIKLFDVQAFVAVGNSGEQLIAEVQRAIKEQGLLVFMFHGVGGEHNMNVDLKAHNQLIRFLKQHENEIWNGTFIEVMKYVKTEQSAEKAK